MKVQDTSETRELTDHELDSVAGGILAVAGAFALGLVTNAAYDWLKSPGDVKAWEAHLKSIL
jgi:hypothetical protein